MEIKKAEILKQDPESGGQSKFFRVTYNDGSMVEFPETATDNRHYIELAEWYGKKKIKPFRHKFVKPGE